MRKTNLASYSVTELTQLVQELGGKLCHVKAIMQSICVRGRDRIEDFQDIPLALKAALQDRVVLEFPTIATDVQASDGVIKCLVKLDSGNCVESVYIPEKSWATLCISSQVGCSLNCDFCATGKQGFNRNLTVGEITGQVWLAIHRLGPLPQPIRNVVFMGMGEPLLNLSATIHAVEWLLSDWGYGLSKYRVTVSTSGLAPMMRTFIAQSPAALALSLHASNDEVRSQLMPINQHYPIEELLAVCREYTDRHPKRKILIEYVMLAGINDSIAQAQELAERLKSLPVKVNLIPFNPVAGTDYLFSEWEAIRQFRNSLAKAGLVATIRETRGALEQAACGQLVGQVQDLIKRRKRGGPL